MSSTFYNHIPIHFENISTFKQFFFFLLQPFQYLFKLLIIQQNPLFWIELELYHQWSYPKKKSENPTPKHSFIHLSINKYVANILHLLLKWCSIIDTLGSYLVLYIISQTQSHNLKKSNDHYKKISETNLTEK